MDPSERILLRCLESAVLAPSLHNSQPWRFRIDNRAVEVHADPDRQLTVLDPDGRELMISLGAAVLTLRVALRAEGWIPAVDAFPDPDRPGLVARVRPQRPAAPSPAARGLAAAIPRRHTNRHPFQPAVVPADAVEQLAEAAAHEGATCTVATPAVRTMVLGLGRAAERQLRHRGGYVAELARWTRPVPGRRDGVPAAAVGPWDALERLPMRDFGIVTATQAHRAERFEAWPTIAVLSTVGDGREEWLKAGQALQRVLLVATRLALATTPISQPVEVPWVREAMSDPRAGRWAQMVIRLGYGIPAGVSPRRPVSEVLLPQGQESAGPYA